MTFTDWLKEPTAVRCVLAEVGVLSGGSETTRYLSSRPYHDGGIVYTPVIKGSSVQLVERINIEGVTASLSYGDIELQNKDGALDDWLFDIWSNREITVLLGDVRWGRAYFQPIFSGVVEDIGSSGRDNINLKMRDKMQRLNTPVSEQELGGSTVNKNQLIPLTFGECHNISPLLANPATLQYQVHDGPIERIIEVRDNGVPVAFSSSLSTGKFTLSVQPFGRVTASVQGDKPSAWNLTASDIIQRLVKDYGEVSTRFTSGDIDTANFSAFNLANPQPLGVHLPQRDNVLNVINRVASSVGARLVMSRAGKLKIIKIDLPPSGPAVEIGPMDIYSGSIYVQEKLPVQAGVKLGYAKNWTIQQSLDTRIPNAHKDMYAKEWLTETQKDATTKTNYRLDGEPEQQDTFLLTESDASAEAIRILGLFKVPRYIISFKGTSNLMTLELGQAVKITHDRFGLSGGKTGVVIALSPNWDQSTVLAGVLI